MNTNALYKMKQARLRMLHIIFSYESIYVIFWEKQYYRNGKQIIDMIGGRDWLKSSAQGHFGEWWNCFTYGYIIVHIYKTHRSTIQIRLMFKLYYMNLLSVKLRLNAIKNIFSQK